MTAQVRRLVVCATALLSAVHGCGKDLPTSPSGDLTPVVASSDWPVVSVSDAGLDSDRLRDLVMRIRRGDYGHVTSLLLARNGNLAVEEYFDGFAGGTRHTMQSVTKSVTSLLIGSPPIAGTCGSRIPSRSSSLRTRLSPTSMPARPP